MSEQTAEGAGVTVPAQRGDRDDPTVTNLILDRLSDLATGFQRLEDRITQRVEGLADQFVPRGEYEARHSDVRNQITKLDGRVDAEITKLESRLDAEAKERKSIEDRLTLQRRYALTTSITALVLIISLLGLIFANLPT